MCLNFTCHNTIVQDFYGVECCSINFNDEIRLFTHPNYCPLFVREVHKVRCLLKYKLVPSCKVCREVSYFIRLVFVGEILLNSVVNVENISAAIPATN